MGVGVNVAVAVGVGVNVAVAVAVGVNDAVAVAVEVGVGVKVAVAVGVNVAVAVGVNVGVGVGVSVGGNATWYMFVNAPKTQISSGGSGTNMYGALIGYDFNANQGSFHFDKAFYNGGVITGGGGILSYSWGTWQACKNPSCT